MCKTSAFSQKYRNVIIICFGSSTPRHTYKEFKTDVQILSCTPIFIAALFSTAQGKNSENVHRQVNEQAK